MTVLAFCLLLGALGALGGSGLDLIPTLHGMAEAIGAAETRVVVDGVATIADCTGPRGGFTTELVSREGATRFVQVRGTVRTELLLKGGMPFSRNPGTGQMEAAPAAVADLIRGHDVHRMLVRLDRWFVPAGEPTDEGCLSVQGPLGPARICRAQEGELPDRIDLVFATDTGTGDMTIRFADWRLVHGLRLPFEVVYEQDGERYTHRIRSIRRLVAAPPGSLPSDPTALFEVLGRVFR